jgi:hypothetical protein
MNINTEFIADIKYSATSAFYLLAFNTYSSGCFPSELVKSGLAPFSIKVRTMVICPE